MTLFLLGAAVHAASDRRVEFFFDNPGSPQISSGAFAIAAPVSGAQFVATGWAEAGSSLSFDGVDDYVNIENDEHINTSAYRLNYSISLFFKAADPGKSSIQMLYEQGASVRGLNIYLQAGSLFAGGWNLPEYESDWQGSWLEIPGITSGQWHQVVLTLDGGPGVEEDALKIYFDGSLAGQIPGSQLWYHAGLNGLGATVDDTHFPWGEVIADTAHHYEGLIEQVGLYDRTLNPDEVAQLAQRLSTLNAVEPPPPPLDGFPPASTLYFDTISDAQSSLGDFSLTATASGVTFTDDVPGALTRAAAFNGQSSYINIDNSSSINLAATRQELTVSLLFKPVDPGKAGTQMLYEQGGTARGLNIYLRGGHLYAGGWNNLSYESDWTGSWVESGQVEADTWHHVALVLDGNATVQPDAMRVYLDGQFVGSAPGSQLWSHSGLIGVGATLNGTFFHDSGPQGTAYGHYFEGLIDEVTIHDGALTAAQVADLAAILAQLNGSDPDPDPDPNPDPDPDPEPDPEPDPDPAPTMVPASQFTFNSGGGSQDASGDFALTATASGITFLESVPPALVRTPKFDGVSSYLNIENSERINLAPERKQLTVSLVFKAKEITRPWPQMLYEQGATERGLNIYIENGKLYAGGWNRTDTQSDWEGSWIESGALQEETWHHVALVLDGTPSYAADALAVYLDGQLLGKLEGSQLWAHTGRIGVGATVNDTFLPTGEVSLSEGHFFEGLIDNVTFHDGALTASEVADLAANVNELNATDPGQPEDPGGGGGTPTDPATWPYVLIDMDTDNELDDLFAVSYGLAYHEKGMHVVGLTSSRYWHMTSPQDSATRGHWLNLDLLAFFGLLDDIPAAVGQDQDLPNTWTPVDSPAAQLIIEQAHEVYDTTGKKLTVITGGALSNVGSALLLDPSIAPKMRLWANNAIGYQNGQVVPNPGFNYNSSPAGAEIVLKQGNLELLISDVITDPNRIITKVEVDARMKGEGGVWDYLVDRWEELDHLWGRHDEWPIGDRQLLQRIIDPSVTLMTTAYPTSGYPAREIDVNYALTPQMNVDFWAMVEMHQQFEDTAYLPATETQITEVEDSSGYVTDKAFVDDLIRSLSQSPYGNLYNQLAGLWMAQGVVSWSRWPTVGGIFDLGPNDYRAIQVEAGKRVLWEADRLNGHAALEWLPWEAGYEVQGLSAGGNAVAFVVVEEIGVIEATGQNPTPWIQLATPVKIGNAGLTGHAACWLLFPDGLGSGARQYVRTVLEDAYFPPAP